MEIKKESISIAYLEADDIEHIWDKDKLKESIKATYKELGKIDLDTVIKEVLYNIDIAKDLNFTSILMINIIIICRAVTLSEHSKDLDKLRGLIDLASRAMCIKRDWNYRRRHLGKALRFKMRKV